MYSSICAEALARMIDAGFANRFGVCEDDACGRAFFDTSKNASRRFCSTTCQNRIKTAAFRQRRAEEAQRAEKSLAKARRAPR
jgi:predicted RNA-binding Zn ribbon-like protein